MGITRKGLVAREKPCSPPLHQSGSHEALMRRTVTHTVNDSVSNRRASSTSSNAKSTSRRATLDVVPVLAFQHSDERSALRCPYSSGCSLLGEKLTKRYISSGLRIFFFFYYTLLETFSLR